jgi:hypothetical protein
MENSVTKILFFCAAIFSSSFAFCQVNTGFESGLNNWITLGQKKNISLDSINQYEGKFCARLGKNATIAQKVEISPLSVLQFNFYVKCSDGKTKVFSFIRFYDMHDRELLEYKSSAISPIKYEQTGNYTETPPFTKYALIGIERDSTEGFVYVDDLKTELNIGNPVNPHKPLCDLDEYMKPFWKSDTIYNETVLLYSENNQTAKGKLLFNPLKIISIKSFDLKTNYQSGIDYSISDNIITKNADSKMPFREDSSFDRKNNLAWFNLQSQWVVVTYTHKEKWNGPSVLYKGNLLPQTISKLQSKSPLSIVAYGMSITRGLDVSSYDTVSPYMPTYVALFARELRKKYHHKNIFLYNAGLPGATVDWGADHAEKYITPLKPDLVIVDFGMNDFWRFTPEQFKKYIQEIIHKVKAGNPKTEFLLLSNMDFDPDYILDSDKNKNFYVNNMQGYKKVLKEFEMNGIINLDMTTLSDFIYQQKKAKDCIANPLHPNDYLARWYAQCMSAMLIQ